MLIMKEKMATKVFKTHVPLEIADKVDKMAAQLERSAGGSI